MKYLKTYENINMIDFYLITEKNPYGQDYVYILTASNIKEFLISKIYEHLDESFENFENECNFNDPEDLLNYYNELDDVDFKYEMSIQNVVDVKLEKWMQERIKAKKYNL